MDCNSLSGLTKSPQLTDAALGKNWQLCLCLCLCLLFLPVLSLGIFCVVHFPSLFFLFPTTTCLSFVVCFAFVDRGHKQLHVALHQQKGDSSGFRLKTGRGYGGGLCMGIHCSE